MSSRSRVGLGLIAGVLLVGFACSSVGSVHVHSCGSEIPVDYDSTGLVLVPGVVEGKSVQLIVDSGARGLFLSSEFAASVGLLEGEPAVALGHGGEVPASLVGGVELAVGGHFLGEMDAVVLDLTAQSSGLGRSIDAVIGDPLFLRSVVVLDYGNETMTLHCPECFQLDGTWHVESLTHTPQGWRVERIRLDGSVPASFVLDTGSDAGVFIYGCVGLGIDDASANDASGVRESRVGVGGEHQVVSRVIREVRWGRFTVRNVSAGVGQTPMALESSGIAGEIGNGVLDQFTVVFDGPRGLLGLRSRD